MFYYAFTAFQHDISQITKSIRRIARRLPFHARDQYRLLQLVGDNVAARFEPATEDVETGLSVVNSDSPSRQHHRGELSLDFVFIRERTVIL